MGKTLAERIARDTANALDSPFDIREVHRASGGSINRAMIVECMDERRWFVKFNDARHGEMFAAEADGLIDLARPGALRVPMPLHHGTVEGKTFLILEYIELGPGGDRADQSLGRGLAAQHCVTEERYGWHRDNTIGSTPQPNGWDDNWAHFYAHSRLGAQLAVARKRGAGARLIGGVERLCEMVPVFFTDYDPPASLLHGDLWGGNWGADQSGSAVVYDPAVYYGDREADLAMTELFGGFGRGFFAAYTERYPVDPGYRARRDLYNLYHVLNHFNLFAGGYAAQAEGIIDRLLAETRG